MSGWGLFAIGVSLSSWSLLLVVSRVLLFSYHFDPWLFTFIQMLAGGAFLIAFAGYRGGAMQALRNPYVWIYGVLRVATAALFTTALIHTNTANATFLGIVSVPISALLLWSVMSRTPSFREVPGHAILLTGLVLLASNLENGWRNPAILLMILSELCVVVSTLIAELHPLNQTDDVRQRAFLTGVMLLASASCILMLSMVLAGLASVFPGLRTIGSGSVAWLDDPLLAIDWHLWIWAIAVGILLRGPSVFLSMWAIHRVRTENYVAGMAALPFISLVLETAASGLGFLEQPDVTARTTWYGCLVVFGSLAVMWARAGRKRASAGG